LERTPLSAADQPPDPCSLLTTREIEAAFDAIAKAPSASPLAMSDSELRACFWFTRQPSGLVSLVVITAASHGAACVNSRNAENPAWTLRTQRCLPLQLSGVARSIQFDPVADVGDQAAARVEFKSGELDVLRGSTLIELTETNVQPPGDVKAVLIGLARTALSRLPA
jgi:hypothetical protein